MKRNKPPPTEEELAERDRLFYESREEEYAKIRQENARKREQDFKKKAEVRVVLANWMPCARCIVVLSQTANSSCNIFLNFRGTVSFESREIFNDNVLPLTNGRLSSTPRKRRMNSWRKNGTLNTGLATLL